MLSIGLFFALPVFSQEPATENILQKKIESIDKLYKSTFKRIAAAHASKEAGRESSLVLKELIDNKLDRHWAAVGTFFTRTRWYYRDRETPRPGEDPEPYPDQLVVITHEQQSAARNYYYEFLFDKNDKLVFGRYKTNDDEERVLERRVYYENGNVLGVIDDGKALETLGDEIVKRLKEFYSRFESLKESF